MRLGYTPSGTRDGDPASSQRCDNRLFSKPPPEAPGSSLGAGREARERLAGTIGEKMGREGILHSLARSRRTGFGYGTRDGHAQLLWLLWHRDVSAGT